MDIEFQIQSIVVRGNDSEGTRGLITSIRRSTKRKRRYRKSITNIVTVSSIIDEIKERIIEEL